MTSNRILLAILLGTVLTSMAFIMPHPPRRVAFLPSHPPHTHETV